ESYRNALQAFIDRRRTSDDVDIEAPCSPDKKRAEKILLAKNNKNKCDNERKSQESRSVIPGVPHVPAPQIFEIGWVAGTEDRYLELIFAEWQNTRVSLKRHSHPECRDAVKADLDVLSEIRHPNVVLLMASTFTDEHGVISILESIDCTLYHYLHDQGERISIQGIAKCGGRLSEALRHSHMRGYVHTAISSHCVYLASNGVVKLGGWELAMHINGRKPEREYEERLRAEIFCWQAPELFRSYEPHRESDVYSLALLIWEMCTMHVPWSGYSKTDVERQYVYWKRGVIMDLYDFPPLLYNLLDAGLQLDVNKRTLDMNRMRRFLQKLEIQYENEGPIYIDQYMNNNNEIGSTYILQTKKSPMLKNKSSKLTKSVSAKQLPQFAISPDSPPRHLYSKKSMSKQNINQKVTVDVEEINFFTDDIKGNIRNDIQKKSIYNNLQNNCKKINYPAFKTEALDTQNEESNAQENSQPWSNTYKKVKAPQDMTESRTTSVYSSPLLESTTDDESFKDARTNLKQLKKILADKREHFFYGSDSSCTSTDISPTSRLFTETRSKDYEPHKPASHKTSLEPKYSKSPNPYDPTYLKSTFQRCHKAPYLHAPEGIKNAVMQPRVLNSDPRTFFETSLWRKEKLICLSKMRKTCADESPHFLAPQSNDSESVYVDVMTDQTTGSTSINSDSTYVIKKNPKETSREEYTQVLENTNESTTPTSPQSEPLQILKDALDRATKIVRSISPNSNDSDPSSPFKYSYQDFEVTMDDNQDRKRLFENLYDLQVNDDDEIKIIEQYSLGKDETFLFDKPNVDNDKTQESSNNIVENYSHSYNATSSRNFICESIAELSDELNISQNDAKEKKTKSSNNEVISTQENATTSESTLNSEASVKKNDGDTETEIKEDKQKSVATFDFMFMNDSTKNKNCRTCHHSTLPRRRSLPAALSQLRITNNSNLGKLPIRKKDVRENTVEDLYIDDEFGDSLNINMVLLHQDLIDEDFLSVISNL
ncbi:unnamed protein product, partial [Heterotrigona itama]